MGGGDPRLRAQRHARRLLRRGARHVRAGLQAGGRLREQPGRLAGVPQRRHHDAGRLVAHQQHAGTPGRRDPARSRRPASGRSTPTAAPTRRWQKYWFSAQIADPRRRRTAGPRDVLPLQRRPDHDGARHPRPRVLPRTRSCWPSGGWPASSASRSPCTSAMGRLAGRFGDGRAAQPARPARPGHDVHPLLLLQRRRVAAGRRHRRHDLDRRRRSRLQMGHGWPPVAKASQVRAAPEPVDRRRDHRAGRHVHPDPSAFGAERGRDNAIWWERDNRIPRAS